MMHIGVGVGDEVVFVKLPGPEMSANKEPIVSAKISGDRTGLSVSTLRLSVAYA